VAVCHDAKVNKRLELRTGIIPRESLAVARFCWRFSWWWQLHVSRTQALGIGEDAGGIDLKNAELDLHSSFIVARL